MSIEKLELVSIAGALPHLNDALTACLQSGVFHIENAAKLLGSAEDAGAGRSDENPYGEALRALSELDLRQAKMNPAAEPLPGEFPPEKILAETERISGSMREVRAELAEIRKKITDYESSAIHLEHLKQADIDLGELVKCRHIVYRFGRMPEESMQQFIEMMRAFEETNYNLSESAAKLYIHKNTLIYRYNKFKDMLGVDPLERSLDKGFMELLYIYLAK